MNKYVFLRLGPKKSYALLKPLSAVKVGGQWSVVKQKMEKSRQARRNVGDKVGKGGQGGEGRER